LRMPPSDARGTGSIILAWLSLKRPTPFMTASMGSCAGVRQPGFASGKLSPCRQAGRRLH
jgi:hypothetical protein